ncbi:MAG: S8 family peptidase [Crocinitomicaceae bacterium]|nr:S8 family peptidase [Crocinitomicaceae bacterium]
MKQLSTILLAAFFFVTTTGIGQEVDKKILNWYNGSKFGMSTDLAYKKLLAGKTSTTVIVAVIDSGVDIEHEDLQGKIWTNTDEIPGNKIDDDKNGYIDDVHGWNFLGNPDGENLVHEQLEMTRLYSAYEKKFAGKTEDQISDEEKEAYAEYKKVKESVDAERGDAVKTMEFVEDWYNKAIEADTKIKKSLGGSYTNADLKKLSKDPELGQDAQFLIMIQKNGLGLKDLESYMEYFNAQLDYHYNVDYDGRKIVGDNPNDFNDKYYGNNDVEGPDAMHGTHCAGIIGANRGNGIGNDGVADNILIMSIRTVPDGDERDKDVANAIRYAVDNGAQVVNMSFGKSFSPYKDEVIAAIRYAEEKGVLLIHAAGNDGKDISEEDNYPSPQYPSMSTRFTNWIEVGASTRYKKALAASFSNYSDKMVDIYAPGLEIWSTVPQSEYEESQGTSMAAPMVTGLAALLKSYYPKLTMFEIKDIILASGQDVSEMITPLPGDTQEVPFGALCITGKIANTYTAVEMAEEMHAKK